MRIRGNNARRAMIGAGVLLLAVGIAVAPKASASGETRTLSLYEIHTKETLTVTYKRDGKYDEEALKKLNHFMRDWRADEADQDGSRAHRSHLDTARNARLQEAHPPCLRLSQPRHQRQAQASGRRPSQEEPAHAGQGLGSSFSGRSGEEAPQLGPRAGSRRRRLLSDFGLPFVHVDTGRVRMWPRIPRLELAALFPDGKTDYLPRDGGRITKKDYQLALAKGMVDRTMVASRGAATDAEPESRARAPESRSRSWPPTRRQRGADGARAGRRSGARSSLRLCQHRRRSALVAASRLLPKPRSQAVPTYENARVVGAPEVDDDHPDELSYVPFETASLMTDTSIAKIRKSRRSSIPSRAISTTCSRIWTGRRPSSSARTSGYRGLASAQKFSGDAVRSLYAEVEAAAPTRLARR